jgi:Na+/proline symporter
LVGLLLAGLFAAAMSTVDSGINGVASVIVFDWLDGKDLSLAASRCLTIALGLLVIIAALIAPLLGQTVIDIIMTIAGTMLGGLMAVFLLGMFAPRATSAGVLIGLATGAVSLILANWLTQIPTWWYGATTIFPTLLAGTISSLFFPPPSEDELQMTFWNNRFAAKEAS